MHAQVRESLCQLRVEVRACQASPLGTAVLPQNLQRCLSCENGERPCAHAQVVRFADSELNGRVRRGRDAEQHDALRHWQPFGDHLLCNRCRYYPGVGVACGEVQVVVAANMFTGRRPVIVCPLRVPLIDVIRSSPASMGSAVSVPKAVKARGNWAVPAML